MARSTTSDRTLIQNFSTNIRFVDDAGRQITCPGAANYTTSIIGNFTALVYANLENTVVPNSTVHALISNNAVTVSTNFTFSVSKSTRKINFTMTDGAASQTFTSSASVPHGWGWIGVAHQQGVAMKAIIGTSVETTAPTITPVANASRTMYVSSTNANTYVRGNLARLWIFGGQLTTDELRNVVYKGQLPSTPTQALIWNMTEGSGTTVADSSGNSNIGTFAGSLPAWSASGLPLVPRTAATTRSIPAALVTRTTI